MSFCFINYFFSFLSKKSLIHFISSQQDIDETPPQKKTLKGCKKSNKIQIDKNIERVQNKQQEIIFK
jgi:hypothetical protein